MLSSTKKSFRSRYAAVVAGVAGTRTQEISLVAARPRHPLIHFKPVGRFWSTRIGNDYRALAVVNGEQVEWFWIGPHSEYERLIKGS